MKYPNRIKECRERAGLPQWAVAQAVRVSPDRYCRVEQGKTRPSYEEARRVADVLGVHADMLFALPSESMPRAS